MKPFSYVVRRTHLYLALFCMPWFVMYGVSSIAFTHADWFRTPVGLYDTSHELWTEVGSWPCIVEIPETGAIPYEVATELVAAAGLDDDAYGAFRWGEGRVDVYFPEFWNVKRLAYRIDDRRITLYTREPVAQQIMTSMHARAGFQHGGLLNDAWAVMVDIVAIGFLLWVATGCVIWWQLKSMRWWGAAALVAGLATFVLFMLTL